MNDTGEKKEVLQVELDESFTTKASILPTIPVLYIGLFHPHSFFGTI